jgi:hypothetical protein
MMETTHTIVIPTQVRRWAGIARDQPHGLQEQRYRYESPDTWLRPTTAKFLGVAEVTPLLTEVVVGVTLSLSMIISIVEL